jgi:putative ABC transport system permease protein
MIGLYRRFVILVKLVYESISFAFGSLKGDKFRTFLSLFGVSIGIFSIVTVFTAIDALQRNVNKGLSGLGSNTAYIQQFPWGPPEDGGEYKWWEYLRRPVPKYNEYQFLKSNLTTADAVCFVVFTNKTTKYKRNSFNSGFIFAPTADWDKISNSKIEKGRYFSTSETEKSIPVAILGNAVAEALFGSEEPVGKVIKIGNENVTVIGVQEKAGESIVNIFDVDNSIMVPFSYAGALFNTRNSDAMICASPKDNIPRDDFIQELTLQMRSVRRLKPTQNINFAVNEMSFLQKQTENIFGGINLAGWIIGGFSILIGGFGIANIMFVSVKERTNLIGIQKALGAKKYTILTQFLSEAATLALFGGVIGLFMVYVIVLIFGNSSSFPMELSVYNIIRGILISSVIGIVSGFVPAYSAANLNPVDAINSK